MSCAVADTSQKPQVLDIRGDAIYGSQGVLCIKGDTPGLNRDSSTWEKVEVATEIALNISDECPSCIDCSGESIQKYLKLPSVQERLQEGYSHFPFIISSSHHVVGDTDYSDCLTIRNRYVSFLVIQEVNETDIGEWSLRVESAYNAVNTGIYTLSVCEFPAHISKFYVMFEI